MHLTKRRIVALFATAAMTLGLCAAGAGPAQADPAPKPVQTSVTPPTPQLDRANKPAGVKAPKGLPGMPSVDSLTPCAGGVCYKYATGRQIFSAGQEPDGISIRGTIAKPYLATVQGDYHTLIELSIQNVDPVSGLRNVVEIGSSVDPTVNGGSNDPHLFVFSWVENAPGSYNGGNGWADALGCDPCAGDSLAGDIGTAKAFTWQHIGTDWWASVNGTYVGAFPDATWGGDFTDAQTVQVFAEGAVANQESCTDTGTGGHAGTASSTNLDQYTLSGTVATPVLSQGTTTDPSIWAFTQPSSTWIRVGGEGYNSVGEALGVKGSCAPAAEGTPAASSLQVWKEQCPDGAAVTGCNSAWSQPWSGQTINQCHALSAPDDKWRRVWGNYLSSGKSIYVYAGSTCGATRQLVTNASKLVTPWDIHAWARAA